MTTSSKRKGNGATNGKRVVLAYSGGVDTSVAIRWLQMTHGAEVITLTLDIGQPTAGMQDAIARARAIGAVKAVVVDSKDEFVKDYLWPALKANALYEGAYPLATALGRPLIAKHLAALAQKEGAFAVAHGCTGKGNDQVRFDVTTRAFAPQLKVIAPMREWLYTREEAIAWAKEQGVPLAPGTSAARSYSIDENLWGRSVESGVLEDATQEPPEDAYAWTASPDSAPSEPATVTIGFGQGAPVSLNGIRMTGVELIQKLNEIAGQHGVGRIDHVENRLVGIKSREVYEAPAAITLIRAHRELEFLTLPKDVTSFKALVEQRIAQLAYDGLWHSPLRAALSAFVDATQERVTGSVSLKLHRGNVTAVSRESPFSLYDKGLSTYGRGDAFDHSAAKGFIEIWGLPLRVQAAAARREEQRREVDARATSAANNKAASEGGASPREKTVVRKV